MIDIKNISLIDIMPPNILKDSNVYASALALDKELQSVTEAINECLILSRIESQPGPVIDHLAWERHVDFYDPTLPLKSKIALVKGAPAWHRYKGTLAAVEELVSDVFGGAASVWEWWKYNGDPYYFKLYVTEDFGEVAKFKRALNAVKNKRSWLEALVFKVYIQLVPKIQQEILVHLKSNNNFWTPYNTQPHFNGAAYFNGAYLFSGNKYGPRHLTIMRRKMFCNAVNEISNIVVLHTHISPESAICIRHNSLVDVYLYAHPGRAANLGGLIKFNGQADFDNLFIENAIAFCKKMPTGSNPNIEQKIALWTKSTSHNKQTVNHDTNIKKVVPIATGRAANFSGRLQFDGSSSFDRTLTRQPAILRVFRSNSLVEEVAV